MEQPILSKVSAGQPVTAQAWNSLVDHIYTNQENIRTIHVFMTKKLTITVTVNDDINPDLSDVRFIILKDSKLYGEATISHSVKIEGTNSSFTAILKGLHPGSYELICQSQYYDAQAATFEVKEDEQLISVDMSLTSLYIRRMPAVVPSTIAQYQNILGSVGIEPRVFDIYGNQIEKITETTDTAILNRNILVQQPVANTPLFEDSEIVLVVSASPVSEEVPPTTTTVPNLIGKSLTIAKTTINASFLLLGTTSQSYSDIFPFKDEDLTGLRRNSLYKGLRNPYSNDYNAYGEYTNTEKAQADWVRWGFNNFNSCKVIEQRPEKNLEVDRNSSVSITIDISRPFQLALFANVIESLTGSQLTAFVTKLKDNTISKILDKYYAEKKLTPAEKQKLDQLLRSLDLNMDKTLFYRFCVYLYKANQEDNSIDLIEKFKELLKQQEFEFKNVLSDYANSKELEAFFQKIENNESLTEEDLIAIENILKNERIIFSDTEVFSSTEAKIQYLLFARNKLSLGNSAGSTLISDTGGHTVESIISEGLKEYNNDSGFLIKEKM